MKTLDYSQYYWKNEKITLRLATEADWEYHYPNHFNSHARFLLNSELELPPDIERDKTEWAEFVSPAAKHGRIVFVIENDKGNVVGSLNLNSIDERNGTFSVGVQIDIGERGKGYGVEATRMIGRYAFLERRLHKWNSAYVESNEASAVLHKRLGFIIEGKRREVTYHDGRYWNDILCGLTMEEFLAVQANRN